VYNIIGVITAAQHTTAHKLSKRDLGMENFEKLTLLAGGNFDLKFANIN